MAVKKSRGHIFKRGNTWHLQFDVNGKRTTRSLNCTSEREAEKKRDLLVDSIHDVKTVQDLACVKLKVKKKPLNTAISEFVSYFENAKRRPGDRLLSMYKYWLNNFMVWLEKEHTEIKHIDAITIEVAREYAKALYRTGISHKTYNEQINCLARMLKIVTGATATVFDEPHIERLEKDSVSRSELSREEAISLLNSITDASEYKTLFCLGIFAGLRLKDAALLKWSDVNMAKNTIAISPYKTKKHDIRVNIPIHPTIRAQLQNTYSTKNNSYVLPEIADSYLTGYNNVVKAVRKIFTANGLSSSTSNNDSHRMLSACSYGFHSLRYTFVSFCAEANIPMALVQDIVGHKNPAMTKHYTRFSQDFQQKAIQSLQITSSMPDPTSLVESIIARLRTASEADLKYINNYLEGSHV